MEHRHTAARSIELGGPRARGRSLKTALCITWPMAGALFAPLPTPAVAQELQPAPETAQELGARDQVNVGLARSASPHLRRSAEADKRLRVEPGRRFEFADHVANGVAL